MKTVNITADQADKDKQSGIEQTNYYLRAGINDLKSRVFLDHALVRAMQDNSVPIADDLRDTKDLLSEIAENIGKIYTLNRRYKTAIKLLEHPVRARVETYSAQEFDQMVLHDKASILSNFKNVRVGDAVDFVMYEPEGTRVRFSRVYLDDKHSWVPAHDDPYIMGWKTSLSDPTTTYKPFIVD